VAASIQVGDRVRVFLNSDFWQIGDWFEGTVVRIDPYSQHRSFYWVELKNDTINSPGTGIKLISVLNPKNIQKL
jgi:hypothetical protein